jgi:hypothetical protein
MNIIIDKNQINANDVLSIFSTAEWTIDRDIEQIKRLIINSDLVILVKDNNIPIGFARVLTDFVCRAFIEDVIVIPEQQFCGIGKLIVQSIESILSVYEINRIELSTNNTHFWEKMGYKVKDSTNHMIKMIK